MNATSEARIWGRCLDMADVLTLMERAHPNRPKESRLFHPPPPPLSRTSSLFCSTGSNLKADAASGITYTSCYLVFRVRFNLSHSFLNFYNWLAVLASVCECLFICVGPLAPEWVLMLIVALLLNTASMMTERIAYCNRGMCDVICTFLRKARGWTYKRRRDSPLGGCKGTWSSELHIVFKYSPKRRVWPKRRRVAMSRYDEEKRSVTEFHWVNFFSCFRVSRWNMGS